MDRSLLDLDCTGVSAVLPSLEHIEVRRPKIRITDRNVDQALANYCDGADPSDIDWSELAEYGVEDVPQLRAELRARMMAAIRTDIQDALRQQLRDALVAGAGVDAPPDVYARVAAFADLRDLLDQRLQDDSEGTRSVTFQRAAAVDHPEPAGREFLVLRELALKLGVDVDEEDVEGRVAWLADRLHCTPSELTWRLSADGTLAALAVIVREEKALDAGLEHVYFTDIDVTADE